MWIDQLSTRGWTLVPTRANDNPSLTARLMSLAEELGEIVPGRAQRLVEPVVPETIETARPGSLSSKMGLQSMPLHTDTAHWSIPCRYLMIGCITPGPT